MLAKYLLGLILEKSSLEESQKEAIDYKSEAVMAHQDDSDWHFKMGLLALKLDDLQWAERFNDQAEFLTLKRGFGRSIIRMRFMHLS